jgi:hypothetical protein
MNVEGVNLADAFPVNVKVPDILLILMFEIYFILTS